MSAAAYYGSLATVVASVWFTPGLDEFLKLYVLTTVILITLGLGLLFRIARLRELVVKHIVAAVLQEVMRDPDILKIINWKSHQERIMRSIRTELERRKEQK